MTNNDSSDVPYSVISIRHSERLNSFFQENRYLRKSKEQLIEIADEKKKMMEPVVEYLSGLGLQEFEDYNLLSNLCTVVAKLSLEQIEDLKKQPFVKMVVLDSPLEMIE